MLPKLSLLLLASLSGCLTPAALAEMAQRADTLSRGAKTDECADGAETGRGGELDRMQDRRSWRGLQPRRNVPRKACTYICTTTEDKP